MGGPGAISPSVLLPVFLDLFFDQYGDPVGKAATIRLSQLSGPVLEFGVDAEIDDFFFGH